MILSDFKSRKTEQNLKLVGKIKVRVLIIFAFTTGLILSTQLLFAASLATDGEKLSQIEQEIGRLEQENAALKVNIAQESSLKTLSQRAQRLGFAKPSQIITP